MRKCATCILALSVLMLAAGQGPAPSVGATTNWAGHSGDADETDYSRLDQINVDNIQHLGLAWFLDLPGEASLEATPLAVNGILYFTGSYGKVYAVDGVNGNLLWTYDPQVWKHNPAKMHLNFSVNRGVAFADGRIFSAALDGRLFALDAKTGKHLWTVETTPRDSLYFITGAPLTFNGKVIIGNAGADFGIRGYVTAYDQATGKQVWRFYVTPGTPEENRGDPAMEAAAKTWTGEWWKTGTGGGPWDAITFDTKLDRIYVGTGNAGPSDPRVRSPGGGDNLYANAIVALDADTGRYVWHYQINPRDAWNYDCTQQMTLATININGKPRDVLMQAPKNGFFYVLDRTDGKLISAEKFGKATWAKRIDLATGRPVEAPNVRYENGESVLWPNPTGAHSWQAMSYSPKTGLVYIPYMQNGVRYYKGPARPGDFSDAGISVGSVLADPQDGKGALLAWDPVGQKLRWKVQHDTIWNGGTLSTAGDLVFQGTADGYFSAYDAASGKRLWRFNADLGIIAPPISYAVNGRQYVSILVGYGGSAAVGSDVMDVGWKWGAPRRLLTFGIDGKETLPLSSPPDRTVHALDVTDLKLDPADVNAGKEIYNTQCVLCHGRELAPAGGTAPDLRKSTIALDRDALWTIVHDGPLMEHGMPHFEYLTRTQVGDIYAFIRAGARKALAKH